MGSNVVLELGHEERSTLSAAAFVANRVLNLDLVEDSAIVQFDEEGVADGALFGVVVFSAVFGLFDAVDLGAERVDAGIGGGGVGAMGN